MEAQGGTKMKQPAWASEPELVVTPDTTGVYATLRPGVGKRPMNDLAFIEDVEREMRSALGAVLGFAEMLATDGHEQLNEKQQRWVEQMLLHGHLLREYVEGSFVLTRSECQALVCDLKPHVASRFVEHIVRGSQWEAAERKIELVASYSTEATFEADRTLLNATIKTALGSIIRAAGAQGKVEMHTRLRGHSIEISIEAKPEKLARPYNFSEVLAQTWQRVSKAHSGYVEISNAPARVTFTFPALECDP